ncbi:MAG: lysine--tRNA ligase, partial [Bradymonadaceae bacterium]
MSDELDAWPYREARTIVERLEEADGGDGTVTLETGFGPSGLPHAGTFAEVARTTWVRRAYEDLTGDDET